VSVFAPQELGVLGAGAGDLRAVPMMFAGAALLVAGSRVVVLAADALVRTLARRARRSFARQ
jgi:hypothetical protein